MSPELKAHIHFQKVMSGVFFLGLGLIPICFAFLTGLIIFSPYGSLVGLVTGGILYNNVRKLETQEP